MGRNIQKLLNLESIVGGIVTGIVLALLYPFLKDITKETSIKVFIIIGLFIGIILLFFLIRWLSRKTIDYSKSKIIESIKPIVTQIMMESRLVIPNSEEINRINFLYDDGPKNHEWSVYESITDASTKWGVKFNDTIKQNVLYINADDPKLGIRYPTSHGLDIKSTSCILSAKLDKMVVIYFHVEDEKGDVNYVQFCANSRDRYTKDTDNEDYIICPLNPKFINGQWHYVLMNFAYEYLQEKKVTVNKLLDIRLRGDLEINDIILF